MTIPRDFAPDPARDPETGLLWAPADLCGDAHHAQHSTQGGALLAADAATDPADLPNGGPDAATWSELVSASRWLDAHPRPTIEHDSDRYGEEDGVDR